MFSEQTQEEIQAHLDGPVAPAWRWLQAVLRDGDYAEAWRLSDPSWRLLRAQAWVLRAGLGSELRDADDIAHDLAERGTTHPLWPEFASAEIGTCRDRLAAWNLDDLGVGSKPRPIDLDYEIVLFARGREWRVYADDALAGVLPFVMHYVGGEWLVATAGSDRLALPLPRRATD